MSRNAIEQVTQLYWITKKQTEGRKVRLGETIRMKNSQSQVYSMKNRGSFRRQKQQNKLPKTANNQQTASIPNIQQTSDVFYQREHWPFPGQTSENHGMMGHEDVTSTWPKPLLEESELHRMFEPSCLLFVWLVDEKMLCFKVFFWLIYDVFWKWCVVWTCLSENRSAGKNKKHTLLVRTYAWGLCRDGHSVN